MASNNNSGNDVTLLIPTHHLVVVRHDRHLNTIKVPLITDESFDDMSPHDRSRQFTLNNCHVHLWYHFIILITNLYKASDKTKSVEHNSEEE